MRLIHLMSEIKDHIDKSNAINDKNKINIKTIFEKYDKNKIGKISIKEFTNIFKELNIPEMTDDDMEYLIICLDLNKDGKLPYNEFIYLLE